MFERLTDEARRVIVHGQEEARMLRHGVIASEHLLLGMLTGDTPAHALLAAAGVRLDDARAAVAGFRPAAKPRELRGHIPFTPNAKRAMELSVGVAGDGATDPAALLAGVLAAECGAVEVLRTLGADPTALAAAARAAVHGSGSRVVPAKRRSDPAKADHLAAEVDRLAAERGRLREALQRYGRHESACVGSKFCTCGLQDALDGRS